MAQREKSWVSSPFFQRLVDGDRAEASLTRSTGGRPGQQWTREQGDVDRHVKDLARPGALTAALNWARANVRPQMSRGQSIAATKIAWSRDGGLERSRSVSDRRTREQIVLSGCRVRGATKDFRRRATG